MSNNNDWITWLQVGLAISIAIGIFLSIIYIIAIAAILIPIIVPILYYKGYVKHKEKYRIKLERITNQPLIEMKRRKKQSLNDIAKKEYWNMLYEKHSMYCKQCNNIVKPEYYQVGSWGIQSTNNERIWKYKCDCGHMWFEHIS